MPLPKLKAQFDFNAIEFSLWNCSNKGVYLSTQTMFSLSWIFICKLFSLSPIEFSELKVNSHLGLNFLTKFILCLETILRTCDFWLFLLKAAFLQVYCNIFIQCRNVCSQNYFFVTVFVPKPIRCRSLQKP